MRSPRLPSTAARAGRTRWARWLAAAVLYVGASLLIQCEALVPRHSWSRRWGPMVPHTTFPGDCSVCHLPQRWDLLKEDIDFDHGEATGHVLEGAHDRAACLRCHNDRGPVRFYLERGCAGCHPDPHKASLGQSCERCHTQDLWAPVGLIADHAATRFPLTAAHAIASCESCHERATTGEFRGAPVACHLCHQDDAARAFPNHPINGWIRSCERCHTAANWVTPGFNHAAFPLEGGHAAPDCIDCHAGGRVAPTPTTCFACHQPDYVAAPDHVAQAFSTNCIECHDIFGFEGAQ